MHLIPTLSNLGEESGGSSACASVPYCLGAGEYGHVCPFRDTMWLYSPAIFLDVPQHQNVNHLVDVIPFQGNATVLGTGPILGEFISCLITRNEMIHIFFATILYSKIVHHQREGNGSYFV